ncbi:hypothetical protein BLNAU_21332 [Blattamonas nauphoetae]|uniref:Uncharacterized protein n=1 Tax=Blattamonas nauphoetae TaxID=2049346 RepID=A0ABQ9WW55_9EUKA|nr:hypothetical protein BLNAU_21332 [Blattamonas nauphoetae]
MQINGTTNEQWRMCVQRKNEAQYASAVAIYNISAATVTNCSFVDCMVIESATLGLSMIASFNFLTSLLFRGCSAENVEASTSGAPNVYFQPTTTANSTLVPQITSTPTVEACSVTINGNVASVEVRTKEVIGGAMGVLLEGCLVPRLMFVVFDASGQNSSIGTATVSSGADGILPSAEYTLRSFVLPGDIGKDANTTTITVKGVTLPEGSYSMLVQSNGPQVNISLSRTDSQTLVGDVPLSPSDAEGRLNLSAESKIIRIEHKKDGTRMTFDDFTFSPSPLLLNKFESRTIHFKSVDSAAELECDLSITDSTTCSIVFPVGWEENTTHLLFGTTYSVQSASCKSVPIVIDSGIRFVFGSKYTVSLSSSRSFEITFSTGTSGTVKACLLSEI